MGADLTRNEQCAHTLSQMPSDEDLNGMAELFKIFGDTTRVRILFVLFQRASSVTDIAQSLAMTTSAISHQLRILKQARLVDSHRDGRTMIYALADDHVYSIFSQALEHVQE